MKSFSLVVLVMSLSVQAYVWTGLLDDVDDNQPDVETASKDQFPFLVGMYPSSDGEIKGSKDYFDFLCLGTIIDTKKVLTTASCINQFLKQKKCGERLYIAQGGQVPSSASSLFALKYKTHEDFNETTYENDIGVILVNKEMQSNAGMQKIILDDNASSEGNVNGTVVGWGYRSFLIMSVDVPRKLLYAEVPVISNEECLKNVTDNQEIITPENDHYGIHQIKLNNNRLCAKFDVKRFPRGFLGDEGSPMFVANEGDGYKMLGLLNYMMLRGGTENFPAIYTRISSYNSWINSTQSDQCMA